MFKKYYLFILLFFLCIINISCTQNFSADSGLAIGDKSGDEITSVYLKSGFKATLSPKAVILQPGESIELKYQVKNEQTGKIETLIPKIPENLEKVGYNNYDIYKFIKVDKNKITALSLPSNEYLAKHNYNKIISQDFIFFNIKWDGDILNNDKSVSTRSEENIPIIIARKKVKSIETNFPDFIKQNSSPCFTSISRHEDIYKCNPVKINGKINYSDGSSSDKGIVWLNLSSNYDINVSNFDPSYLEPSKISFSYFDQKNFTTIYDTKKYEEALQKYNSTKSIAFKDRLEGYISPDRTGFYEIIGVPLEYFLAFKNENAGISIPNSDAADQQVIKNYSNSEAPLIRKKITVIPNQNNPSNIPDTSGTSDNQNKRRLYVQIPIFAFGNGFYYNSEANTNNFGDVAFTWGSDYSPETGKYDKTSKISNGVYARVFSKEGEPKALTEFRVNGIELDSVESKSNVSFPNIAINDTGNVVVCWIKDNIKLYARSFSQDGKPITPEILIAEDKERIYFPKISLNNKNNIVIAWKSGKKVSSEKSVYYSYSDYDSLEFFGPSKVSFKSMNINGKEISKNIFVSNNLDLSDVFINENNELILSCRSFSPDKDIFDKAFIRKYSLDGNNISEKYLENVDCQNKVRENKYSLGDGDCISKPEISVNKSGTILVYWITHFMVCSSGCVNKSGTTNDSSVNKSHTYLQRFSSDLTTIDNVPFNFPMGYVSKPNYIKDTKYNNDYEGYNRTKIFDDNTFDFIADSSDIKSKNGDFLDNKVIHFDQSGKFTSYNNEYIVSSVKKYFIQNDRVITPEYSYFEVFKLNDKKDN